MDPKDLHRKLAVILITDVADYSRIMQDDETATVATLESNKQAFQFLQTASLPDGGIHGT